MSRPHDAQRSSLPFGNPFRMILPKGSYLSPKLLALLNSFERSLAESLRKLKPENPSGVLSLPWMGWAMESLIETHTGIKSLTAALQFPGADWDEKWTDMYLANSVKLLDICIALTSEVSRLDQSQLLLKYVLHILNSSGAPSEQHKRVHSSLNDWKQQIHSRCPKLESCFAILHELASGLHLVKVKNSARGKVLMRALYGVKVVTIYICSVLTVVLSGCSKPLVDLQVSGDFLWADAFNDLQADLNKELRSLSLLGKPVILKELAAVDASVEKLHSLSIGKDTSNEEVLGSQKPIGPEEQEAWKECASDLAKGVEALANELDLLSKQLGEFFQLVLNGRDALLSSLRASDVK